MIMKLVFVAFLLSVLWGTPCGAMRKGALADKDLFNVTDCEIQTFYSSNVDGTESKYYSCISYPNARVYDLPQWLIDQFIDAYDPEDYPTFLRVKGPRSRQGQVIVGNQSSAEVQLSRTPFRGHNRRNLEQTAGIHHTLVLRVIANGVAPPLDAATISERVFGPHGTPRSAFRDCSFGKLLLKPATGANIDNGVVDIHLSVDIGGAQIRELENLVTNSLLERINTEVYENLQHIIVCVPKGSLLHGRGWLAYAYLTWNRAYFNGESCGYLSNLAHEFGHNLGLGHSSEGKAEYGDESGIMGYGYARVGYPITCFNGAKNWRLGWYSDKQVLISEDDLSIRGWSGSIYGYVDYDIAPGNVLIRVKNLILQYNKIGTINRDTIEKRDKVVVTETSGSNARSLSLAGLDVLDHTFTSTEGIVVYICDHVQPSNELDYFVVSIHKTTQPNSCSPSKSSPIPSQVTPAPTPRITSVIPTLAPYRSLTQKPISPTTQPITRAPIRMPTPDPTTYPTKPPTPLPTFSPTTSAPIPWPTFPPFEAWDNQDSKCDDDIHEAFFVNEVIGWERCSWLVTRPTWQLLLCHPESPAYYICEETCGRCVDDCHDSGGSFYYLQKRRSCAWLSIRWYLYDIVCNQSQEARRACPETCGVCDGTTFDD